MMRVGVILPSGEWPDVLDAAKQAVGNGAASLWVTDSFSNDALETLTQMSALASDVPDVEVGAYMLNPSLRDRQMLTAMLASLHRIAPRRVRVLLGTGWQRADYEALGRDFPAPDERLADARETLCALKDRGIRVEIAGVRDDIVRLAAREADGWAVSADALDAFFERVALLRDACEEAGRAQEEVRVSCTLREDEYDRVGELVKHGVDEVRVADADAVRRFAGATARA